MDAEITLRFDSSRGVVNLDIQGVPIGLAQMMVHEAAEQLGIMRRRAAAEQLQHDANEARRLHSILGGR